MERADPRRRLRAVPTQPTAPRPQVTRPAGTEPLVAPPASALQFSESVRAVVALARRHRLRPPVFRSPPGLAGVDRSIRRRSNGTVVVAVRRSQRPLSAVRADIIDGVVAANGLDGERADQFRRAAWAALEGPAVGERSPSTVPAATRVA